MYAAKFAKGIFHSNGTYQIDFEPLGIGGGTSDPTSIFESNPQTSKYIEVVEGPTEAPQKDTLFGMDKKLAIALIVCLVLVLFGSSMMSMMMMR